LVFRPSPLVHQSTFFQHRFPLARCRFSLFFPPNEVRNSSLRLVEPFSRYVFPPPLPSPGLICLFSVKRFLIATAFSVRSAPVEKGRSVPLRSPYLPPPFFSSFPSRIEWNFFFGIVLFFPERLIMVGAFKPLFQSGSVDHGDRTIPFFPL